MSDPLIDRCRKLLELKGGRETAREWPVPIARDDLRALIRRAEANSAPSPQQPWPISLRADRAIDRALHPVDWS